MSTFISSLTVLVSKDKEIISWHCKGIFNFCLFEQLAIYHRIIGVDACQELLDGTRWRFNEEWYSINQIERMVKLPSFT